METTSQPSREAATAEPPSQHAELMISIGPAPQWGTAKGLVPADQAHHLVTTFGILGSLATGAGAAVLTLHAGPGFAAAAYAELVLAFVCAILIAFCSRTGAKSKGKRQKASIQAPTHSSGKRPPDTS
jgi:hypothetical protein